MGLCKPREHVKLNQPYILVRESTCSMQLVMYSLDICVRYYFVDFQASKRLHKGPDSSHNHLIDSGTNVIIKIATGDVLIWPWLFVRQSSILAYGESSRMRTHDLLISRFPSSHASSRPQRLAETPYSNPRGPPLQP